MGFWWHFDGDNICEQYLQLEEAKFCIKIWVKDKAQRGQLRDKWYNIIKDRSHEFGLKLKKPRFGTGESMTILIADEEYRKTDASGHIDIGETIKYLRKAEHLLDAVREGR